MCRYSEVKDSSRASLTSVWKLRRLSSLHRKPMVVTNRTRHASLSQWKEDELFQEPRGSGDGSESHRLWDPVPPEAWLVTTVTVSAKEETTDSSCYIRAQRCSPRTQRPAFLTGFSEPVLSLYVL